MSRERFVIWEGIDAKRWEVARLVLGAGGLEAVGSQVGIDPVPYRLDYRLEAGPDFITRALDVRASGEGWWRTLELRHDGCGRWDANVATGRKSPLPPPSASTDGLTDARDCDLGFSPLTNLMPVRRHGLLQQTGFVEILTAWLSVPELALQPYRQRYEHVRRTKRGALVRFVDLGLSPGFTAELEFDRDGIVEHYPQLARRLR